MNARIARAYGGWPHESWHWPLTYWIRVRDELIDSWKPVKSEDTHG